MEVSRVELCRYSYVLAPELARSYKMTLAELGYHSDTELVAVRAPLPDTSSLGTTGSENMPLQITPVNASYPLVVHACTPRDFELVQLSPKLPGGW